MHVDPITEAAAPAPQQAPAAILPQEAAAQQAEQQAAQDAAQAAQAGEAAEGAQETPGFRIVGADGKVITVGPEGVVVSTGQPDAPPDIPSIPQEVVAISMAFFLTVILVVIGWPIARAIARRMDRATVAPARVPAGQTDQLRRIEQAVEAMAIEVERVSENQRFVTKLLSEGRPDGALLARAAGEVKEVVSVTPGSAPVAR